MGEPEVGAAGQHLVEQPRLAEPGLAPEQHRATTAGPRFVHRRVEHRHLVVATAQRMLLRGQVFGASDRPADRPCLDGLRLSFHVEGLELGGLEPGRRPFEHRAAREDLPLAGLGHQSRREVHGVAHHGVGAPVVRTDVAREYRAVVHTDPHADRALGLDDPAQRQQEALLVLADGARGAGGQDQLAPVGVDVGAEETHAELVDRSLRVADEPVELAGQHVRPFALDQRVGAVEVDESHRHLPVLGLGHAREQRVAGGERHAAHQQLVRYLGQDRDRPGRLSGGRATQEHPVALRVAARGGGQQRGGHRAHHDLAGVGRALHRDDLGRGGTGDDELPVRIADEEQVERARVHADRHPEVDAAAGGLDPADLTQSLAHPDRGPRRTGRLVLRARRPGRARAARLRRTSAGSRPVRTPAPGAP